jgi:DNA repair exonuclease SbcCD ATPase subunit
MRILWIDSEENPWTEASGWQVLEDFGLEVSKFSSVSEARLSSKNFDLLLARAEVAGVPSFLVEVKKELQKRQKLILVSSEWTKDQFKSHSKTDGAAHRYARVPMPPEGFLSMVADLFDCKVEELKDIGLKTPKIPASSGAPKKMVVAPEPKKKFYPSSQSLDSEDSEVLKKYLRIKEEQLEISESERNELSQENERLQRDAMQLQLKLRDLEHLQEELTRKLQAMENEKQQGLEKQEREKEDLDRANRNQSEKLRNLEAQLHEADEKYENLRVRVRKDIRKIRENERDLEARLELLRKDSETLLQARDQRVLEMQRKVDALEFDLDQIQDGKVRAQMEAERYLGKLSRVARALHLAVNIIEDDITGESELEEMEPILGGAGNAVEILEEEKSQPEAASAPPVEGVMPEGEDLSEELQALAADGEPTQMISQEALTEMSGEPESSSG